jgi:hypothetical protein
MSLGHLHPGGRGCLSCGRLCGALKTRDLLVRRPLAKPGGNITGLTKLSAELSGKRLEILRELVPGISGIALFHFPQQDEEVAFCAFDATTVVFSYPHGLLNPGSTSWAINGQALLERTRG